MKANRKVQTAWAFYDWANSSYNLVIGTAIFPLFYSAVTQNKVPGAATDDVLFFGRIFKNTEVLSYCLAVGMACVCVLSPALSGIADYMGRKKFFLQFFCYLGALACASLFFFNMDHFEWSMLSVVLACLGFWCSYAFANAFLPELAAPAEQDKLSAKAFSYGYVGSILLLIINLAMVQWWGIKTQWCFVTVAVWWAGFAQYTFHHLKEEKKPVKFQWSVVGKGFGELQMVWRDLRKTARLKRYLVTFFVMSMGVQTIMQMASLFGTKEIVQVVDGQQVVGLGMMQLIVSVLLVQLIAIPGALLFSFSAKKIGNLPTLKIALLVWCAVCLFAYYGVHVPVDFYIAAGIIGFIMGGTQALARSTYSKFLPETHETASYFSFYDVTEKVGLIIGLLLFGFLEGAAGNMRASVLALISFFAIGFILMWWIPKKEIAVADKVFPV